MFRVSTSIVCVICCGVFCAQLAQGEGGLLLRPEETTSAEYEVLYQTFIGTPTPSLEMRTKIRVEYQKEGGYRLQFLSLERFEAFPAPGGWKKITVDPVMPPGGNEPPGVDIDISHHGSPTMSGVVPPDIPAFSYTFVNQMMMILYLLDGTLPLEELAQEGDSITVPGYSFTWQSERYAKIQAKSVPESTLRVESSGDDLIELVWDPEMVLEYRLIGFDYELRIVAMEETVAWRLQVDPQTGIIEHAITEYNTLLAVPITKTQEIALPEHIDIPEDAKRYRTDRLIQMHRLDK